ncbi:nuclear transport factor 2 family protein [Robiginitalea aurantiaca]|uniref:Nuclear transport factor 2 family protein n=1 Tax=Robiginitalea aurantiaca TaxID=3056915 RepID=A0ABT7WAY4_9FLAO|nr:nuclear transport factor 2 family protein [Robiginitalea aurantiaca]MDM9630080.1 nuclear transport factor 2 family protein [Robiginitalea aurantiaca]
MNTDQIASTLVDCCRKGEWEKAYMELYSPAIVSIETGDDSEMGHIEGMEGLKKKGDWWAETFDVHHVEVSDPIVADNWFTVRFEMDTTHKPSQQRSKSSELAVYRVADGKIVWEQFFYDRE